MFRVVKLQNPQQLHHQKDILLCQEESCILVPSGCDHRCWLLLALPSRFDLPVAISCVSFTPLTFSLSVVICYHFAPCALLFLMVSVWFEFGPWNLFPEEPAKALL